MKAEAVIRFLEAVAKMTASSRGIHGYHCLEEFVLKHGTSFTPHPLPAGMPFGEPRNCFGNSANLAMMDPRLTYCEGYAIGVLPVHHAWVVNRKREVIDVTWRSGGVEYYGIPIRTAYLVRRLRLQERYGLIDVWEERWPMLKDPPSKWLKTSSLPAPPQSRL